MQTTHSNEKLPTRSMLAPLLALVAGLMVLAVSDTAEARCASKPAVCRLAELRQARLPDAGARRARPVDATPRCASKPAVCARMAKATPTPRMSAKPAKSTRARCTSKPAVCSRIAAAKARMSEQPVAVAPKRCTSKPAVCGRRNKR